MLNFYLKKLWLYSTLFMGLILFSSTLRAQCAGTSNIVTVCEKQLDPLNQTFNLFAQLGGNPVPGGSWVSDNPSNNTALDENSGIVNLWAINTAGLHSFTYSNPSCDATTASVTVTLGGYSGEDNVDGGANACQGDLVNLFTFLDSISLELDSDTNGYWEEVEPNITGQLNSNYFNTADLDPGYYTFDYTVAAVGTCAAQTSRVILELHRIPASGAPQDINFCETDDLSQFTSVDLFDYLEGEDENGQWLDGTGSGQISFPADHIINVQELFDDYGEGIYSFTYRVDSSQGVCQTQMSVVNVYFEKQLKINGSLSADNACNPDNSVILTINFDPTLLNNGLYDITWLMEGGIDDSFTSEVILVDGTGTFELLGPFPVNQSISVSITEIGPVEFCESIIEVTPASFIIEGLMTPEIDVFDICFNESPTIILKNITDTSLIGPSNETFSIAYTMTSPSGDLQLLTSPSIAFVNGSGAFTIDSATISESGSHTISILNPYNFIPVCPVDELSASFEVNPRPDDVELNLIVDNPCDSTNLTVNVVAPTLENGEYFIEYKVVELNQTTILISNSITFTGGLVNYDVNIANLPQGNYLVTLTSVQNDTTPCREQFEFEKTVSFSINGIPNAPVLESEQTFCRNSFSFGGPTIADIQVQSAYNLLWYDTETSQTPLPSTTPLINGEDYYATNTDPLNNCQSSNRSKVVVTLSQTSIVITENTFPRFCIEEGAKVSDLSVQTQNGGNLVWYDAANGGNTIDPSSFLEDGKTYYAAEQSNGCESYELLAVTPSIKQTPNPEIENFAGDLCGMAHPTVSDLEEKVSISGSYELFWYADEISDSQLSANELLIEMTYYLVAVDSELGCESDRIPVNVTLRSCSSNDFTSLIPDGFSPNNDAVNDTFRLVNFDFVFPDYSIVIYNRYGKVLFKGNAGTGPWDGTSSEGSFGNGIVPTGVYFYVVEFNKDNIPPKQGRLYLSR